MRRLNSSRRQTRGWMASGSRRRQVGRTDVTRAISWHTSANGRPSTRFGAGRAKSLGSSGRGAWSAFSSGLRLDGGGMEQGQLVEAHQKARRPELPVARSVSTGPCGTHNRSRRCLRPSLRRTEVTRDGDNLGLPNDAVEERGRLGVGRGQWLLTRWAQLTHTGHTKMLCARLEQAMPDHDRRKDELRRLVVRSRLELMLALLFGVGTWAGELPLRPAGCGGDRRHTCCTDCCVRDLGYRLYCRLSTPHKNVADRE